MGYNDICKIDVLAGKTLTDICSNGDIDELIFTADTGEKWLMHHKQQCCEWVTLDDIAGEFGDLIGVPILAAYEERSHENPEGIVKEKQDSFTWTFYRLRTIKGTVVLRWYGESNGYYSESVDFERIPN